jgi:RNA polymerase sigma-70 factor (ECF subfamily)
VARWVAKLGGTWVDPQDALQEVFMVVHKRLHSFHGPTETLPVWLFGIARNVVRQQRRRERIRRFFGAPFESGRDVPAGTPSPLATAESREKLATAYRALDGLSEKHRTTLILFEVEGLSGDEIAELTLTKRATVFVNIHRARAAFLRNLRALEAEVAE